MRTCLTVRHVAFEDLGLLGPILAARGMTVETVEAGVDDVSAADPLAADLWVVLGGPIGVYESGDYPFLEGEVEGIGRRLRAGRPTLGICLGAQLMASALGARVAANPRGKEIGWSSLDFTPAGQAHPLGELGGSRVLHWHGDIFDLPEGAQSLASTPVTPHQAFAVGAHGLGLQFHLEVEAAGLERWLIGHRAELGQAGLSIPGLRRDNLSNAPLVAGPAARALERWLDGAGL